MKPSSHLLLVLLVSAGCSKTPSQTRQAEAIRLAGDATLSNEDAARRAADACVPFRTLPSVATQMPDSTRQVVIYPEEDSLTSAPSVEALKELCRQAMAERALCVLRATKSRGVNEVVIHQSLQSFLDGPSQEVYLARLRLESLTEVPDWDRSAAPEIAIAAAPLLTLEREDFAGIRVR